MDKGQLLKDEVQEFINSHINDDIPSLILKKSTFANYPINDIAEQIASKRKASKKLPTWYSAEGILYPSSVSIEQCSSEITANSNPAACLKDEFLAVFLKKSITISIFISNLNNKD
jgi:hypothetical protein